MGLRTNQRLAGCSGVPPTSNTKGNSHEPVTQTLTAVDSDEARIPFNSRSFVDVPLISKPYMARFKTTFFALSVTMGPGPTEISKAASLQHFFKAKCDHVNESENYQINELKELKRDSPNASTSKSRTPTKPSSSGAAKRSFVCIQRGKTDSSSSWAK